MKMLFVPSTCSNCFNNIVFHEVLYLCFQPPTLIFTPIELYSFINDDAILGVTTIAGGSKIIGKADGPGRNASFSTDFELAFIPERCALMICDHGHQLVRQINLKSQDCARGSHSGKCLEFMIQL